MRRTTSRPRTAIAVGALAGLTALAVPAAAATVGVRVGSYYFEDAHPGDSQVVVAQGDRITFTFEGKVQHTATVDGLFNSGPRSPGQRYTTPTLTKVGTFTLYCQVHGARQHGTALIIRRKPAPSPSPTRVRPSVAPTKSPSPRPSSAAPSPSPSPSPAPSPSPSPSPLPSSSPNRAVTPRPTTPAPSPSSSSSPEAVAGTTPDLIPAGPLDDSGPSWLLPGAGLVLLLLLGAVAVAVARRRRQGF